MNPSGRALPGAERRILGEALARARAAGHAGVLVFDLDSTLLDNRPRQAHLLAGYGAQAGEPRLVASRPGHWRGWDAAVAMRAVGLSADEVARHMGPYRRWWLARFFTSEACALDEPLPGAAAFLDAVHDAGAQVAYVTGRPEEMGAGTLATFSRARFPMPDGRRVHLLLRPAELDGDDAWKEAAVARVARLGHPEAAFDNEPLHVNGYARAWPDALVVHLDTDHSGRPVPVLGRVPSIGGWAY
jgi:hypothetical protein